jgi:2-oxoglutarate dehydrogenase E1 component
MPLQHLAPDQAPVEIINSPLSEAGVLGFELGYSAAVPDGLVLWEAQFGDFVNCAQVIIDQFISSGEDKWHRLSGIVLLLPHGFEGQGPEHSSARIERFLSQAAENNIQVVVPSTPANYFHVLRRQVLRPWRKPLIVFTPKSLLRNRDSTLEELATGGFWRVIGDSHTPPATVKRVLLCCGKMYHELAKERETQQRSDVAIVRIEQLYPLREDDLLGALAAYREGTPVQWVQEEPENMGAWRYLQCRFGASLFERFPFSGVYRRASASPATGSHGSHKIEQQRLIERALGGPLEP